MADVTYTPVALAAGTASDDVVVGTLAGHSTTTGQTISIPAGFNDDLLLVIKFSGTSTLTIDAGANPPSGRADKGTNTQLSGTNAQVKLLVLEKGRHVQADGTITGTNTGATIIGSVYRLPPGFVGALAALGAT